MSDEHVRFALDDGVATITLDRPEADNAVSPQMIAGLSAAYRRCDEDDAVRAVVLTGAGRAFCVGADLGGGAATFERQESEDFSAAAVDPPAFAVRKPVIAAVGGHAIGLGFTLALQCDLRILARDAKYGVVQVRRGVMPDAYAHFTLPRIAGFAVAADLLQTGRRIQGDEALALGLASRVLPAAEVLPAAQEIARDIATHTAPLSVAVTKKLLWESGGLSAAEVERKETALHHLLMGRADAIEGVVAYLERRTPDWKLEVSQDWPDDWPR
ncbi:MAG: enoyl-CoA hydratase-related protein [Myxococcota bacterium]